MADENPDIASDPIRVFLLDDHEIVRRGIKDLLESAGDIVVVGEAGSARGGDAAYPGRSVPTSPSSTVVFPTVPASTSAVRSDRAIPTSRH